MIFYVLGTGRSGTSTVGRILHTKFGISMGDEFNYSDTTKEANPLGNFEDAQLYQLDTWFVRGMITLPFYLEQNNLILSSRVGSWGYKSPLLCYTLTFHESLLKKEPILIWADRDIEAAAKSCMRHYKWDENLANSEIERRHIMLERLLKGRKHYRIFFDTDNRTSDKDVAKFLKEVMDSEGFDLDSHVRWVDSQARE